MHRSTLAGVLMAYTIAGAQDTGGNLTSTPGPTSVEGETVVHTVTVGLAGHIFDPSSLLANPGDKVMFQFYPGNHSFIQSLYAWPCVPEEAVDGAHGIYSGQFPNVEPDQPVIWNLTVNDTTPIWYYCGAPGSCINFGMLGAINPTNASQVEAQMDLAKQARYIIYPNDTLPAAAASSIAALAANVLPRYWANDTSSDSTSKHHGLSAGAIAGIAIGGAAALAIIGVLIFCLGRIKGQVTALKETVKRDHNTQAQPQSPRQEMTVDGVTYVPAVATGTLSSNASYLPPDNRDGRFSPELESKSPESTLRPYSPPLRTQSPYVVRHHSHTGYQNQGDYTESTELGIHVPQPRHELAAVTSIPVHDLNDVEGGPKHV